MKTLKRTLMLVAVAALSFACAKPGCTDQNATNYNSSAKKDDGSCRFPAPKVSFYTSQSKYSDFVIMVNGVYRGTLNSFFPSGTPQCGQQGTLTVELNYGTNQIYVEAADENFNFVMWETTITVPQNEFYCKPFLLY